MKRLALLLALGALAAAPASAGAAKTVRIEGFLFKPGNLTVAKGTKVTFVNRDRAAHTATDRGAFDSGRIKGGNSFTVRFRRKGTFAYLCTLHPEMRGRVVVN